MVVAQTRLKVVDEQRAHGADEHPKRDVDDPVDAKVEDGEGEDNRVVDHKAMVASVNPILHSDALVADVEDVQQNDAERDGDVQRRHGVVQWIVVDVEGRIQPVVVEQRLHARNPRRRDLDVEKEVIWNGEGVDEQIIQRDLVRQIPLPDVAVKHGRHVNQKQVNEEVMEVQHRRQGR